MKAAVSKRERMAKDGDPGRGVSRAWPGPLRRGSPKPLQSPGGLKADPAALETAGETLPEERGLMARLRGSGQAIAQRASSSLTRRIVVLNLAGLVALLVGFLYLNQFRQGLIEARVQSLLTQGEIIAGAVASSATVETDTITIDPDRLLQMQTGDTERLVEESLPPLEFSISPERVAPLLRRLVTPTRTRARIYDREGALLLDSRSLAA